MSLSISLSPLVYMSASRCVGTMLGLLNHKVFMLANAHYIQKLSPQPHICQPLCDTFLPVLLALFPHRLPSVGFDI